MTSTTTPAGALDIDALIDDRDRRIIVCCGGGGLAGELAQEVVPGEARDVHHVPGALQGVFLVDPVEIKRRGDADEPWTHPANKDNFWDK